MRGTKYKAGEIYKLKDYSAIVFIGKENSNPTVLGTTGSFPPYQVHRSVLERFTLFELTDPEEKAYWLLKLENKRN